MGWGGGSLCSEYLGGYERPVQFGKGQTAAVSFRIEALRLQPPGDSQSRPGRKLPWNWIQKLPAFRAASLNRDGSRGLGAMQTEAAWRMCRVCREMGRGAKKTAVELDSGRQYSPTLVHRVFHFEAGGG